jgi:RHS repeat-associated protein
MRAGRVAVLVFLAGLILVPGSAVAVRAPRARAANKPVVAKPVADPQGVPVGANSLVALEQAAQLGRQVIVGDQTTKTTMVMANPDGTLTSTIAGGPVREPDASSSLGFSPIDLSLHSVLGVGLQPRLADAPIAISEGKSTFLASLGVGKDSIGLDWESALPPPTVEGNTATYADVEPGVDLQVAAYPDGFDVRIVLKRRPSGATSFTLPLKLDGITASVGESGRLVFESGGKPVAAADPPMMWGAGTDETGDPTKASAVPVSLDAKGALVVSPSSEFLSDQSVEYPVTIDPAPNLTTTLDTYVDSGSPTSTFSSNTKLRSGNDGSSVVDRSLLQFNTSSLTGTHIVSASLNLHETWSGSCTASSVQVWDLSTSWSSSVTWNTQPTKNQMWASGNTNAGFGASCPDAWVSFSGGGSGSNTLTGLIQGWASGTLTNNGVEVVAADEVNTTADKRFDSYDLGSNQPYLAVTYNSYPSSVLDRWPDNAAYVNTLQPKLHADFFDPDSGAGQVQFEVDNNSTGANVVTALGTSTPAGGRSYYTVGSGLLSDGVVYKWRARGYDGTDYSSWSSFRTFTTDTTLPTAPSVSSSTNPSQTSWYTSSSYSLSFSSTDGGSGVSGYEILVNQKPGSSACGTPQTATTYSGTVPSNGVWYAHVAAVDNAGNVGTTTTYELNIGNGTLLTPLEGDQTASKFNLQALAPSGVTSVKIQYRRAPNDAWTNLPTADVKDGGTAISSWPVSIDSGTHLSHLLEWNAYQTLGSGVDGGLQLRANFTTGGGGAASPVDLLYATQPQNQVPAGGATEPVGPGSVDLVTGDFNVAASDASVGGLSVDRSFDSLAYNASSNGVFGPGWSSSVNLGSYVRLHDGGDASQGSFVTVYEGDDSEVAFYLNIAGTAYITATGSQGYALTSSGSGASRTWTLTDPDGAITTFAYPSGMSSGADYYPSTFTPATGAPNSTGFYYTLSGSQVRLSQETVALPGVTCTQSGATTTPGCRSLTFTYAGSTGGTGNCGTSYGDYNQQLKSVAYTAYNPSTAGMATVTVEHYAYDSNGRLRAACDPRPSGGALTTQYAYDGTGRVSTITPPGTNAWTINYDSSSRVITTVINNDPSGTETTTVVYGIAMTVASGGPYDMGSNPSTGVPYPNKWAQQDVPTNATAIFPATEVPSGAPADYNQATVYYTDQKGQLVNVAQPVVAAYSADGLISTTEYDADGNVIRTLSPLNRITALTAGSQAALIATTLDSQSVYSGDGTELLETLGPQHLVALTDGTTPFARSHVVNTYGATSTYGQGLLTQSKEGALKSGTSSDVDVRTTTYDYTGTHGLDLGLPTTVAIDPSGLNIRQVTRYDANGNVIATIMPGNPSGGDAHETDTTYYIPGTGSGVTACDSKPWFAGLVCQTAPAAQPSGSLPNILTTTYTYDIWGNPLTRTDTSGATNRVWTFTYDAAGRLGTTALSGGPGTSLATVTQAYDAGTGQPSTSTDGTNTVTRVYDNLGRLKTYTDASSNASNYTYDVVNRVATMNDGKATQTYTYETSSDQRGLITSVADSAAGTFTAKYDADANLIDQHLPNGLDQCTTYDEVGQPTERLYQSGGACATSGTTTLLDYTALTSVHGQWLASSGPSSTGNAATVAYTYDSAGRLAQVQDTLAGQCTTRQYGFDADSNRTQYIATGPGSGGACQSGTLATVHSYDAADRLTDTGIAYDAMGRTTTLPAADAGGTQQTFTYYANDQVNTLTQGTVTHTATLDPTWRIRTWATSADSTATQTDHYASDTDVPAWISENTANTAWTRMITGADGSAAATQPSTGSIVYQLANLRGDTCATADSGGSILTTADYQEYGAPRAGTTTRYGWLGSFERQADATTGAVLMGARVYAPTIGRFLQVDPVSGGSANDYDYTNQSPLNSLDLSGTVNGCGSSGIQHWLIGILAGSRYLSWFTPACNWHDLCYSWWGSWRSACDGGFLGKAIVSCIVHVQVGGSLPTRQGCFNEAGLFYNMIRRFGRGAFISGHVNTCLSHQIWGRSPYVYSFVYLVRQGHSWPWAAAQTCYIWSANRA